jgi:CBS domain-containing protein
MDDGELVGIVTLEGVKAVPAEGWASSPAARAMTPLHECAVVTPATTVEATLHEMNRPHAGGRALVVDRGQLVGIISASDVARWLQRPRMSENAAGPS